MEYKYIVLLLLHVLTLVVCFERHYSRQGLLHDGEPVPGGYTQALLLGTSVNRCLEECEARPGCTSINYHGRAHVCRLLHMSPGYSINAVKSDGHIHFTRQLPDDVSCY